MPAASYRKQHPREQGVNWGLFVGGAVATVLSLAFTRGGKNKSKSKAVAAATLAPAPAIPAEQHGNASAMETDWMLLRRESSSESSSSSGSNGSSGGENISGGAHRQAVHRLRDQLKSRDAIIMEMQALLSSKEKALHSHTSLVADLERQLKEANDSIFEVERVIHELHGAKSSSSAVTSQSPRSSEAAVVATDMGVQCSSDSDEHEEPGEHEEHEEGCLFKTTNQENIDKGMVLHATEGDYQLVFERAKHLEAELVGIRAMAQEMASLLEMSERERLRLHHVVSQLQQKLAFQAKEINTMRATTHFLKVSLGSRKSGDDFTELYNTAARLSRDNDGNLLQLRSSGDAKPKTQQRYATASVDSSLEVSEIVDPAGRDENSTSSSAGSFWSSGGREDEGELEEEQESGRMDYANFRPDDSPGAVRIGSPTIVGSRSSVDSGTAQRYLFDDPSEELGMEDDLAFAAAAARSSNPRSSLEVVVEEEEGSSGSSSVMDEMLDDSLEDLVKATRPVT